MDLSVINGFTDLASKDLVLSIAALILKKEVGFWIIMLMSNQNNRLINFD